MNFLNSYAFEQMAREYHAKYNVTQTLNKKDDEIWLKVKNNFEEICRLFCMLKNSFFRYSRRIFKLNELFQNFDNWTKEAKSLFENNLSVENCNQSINHQKCAIIFIDLLNDYIYIIDNICTKKDYAGSGEKYIFFEKAKQLYIEFFKIIKNFYKSI